MSTAALITYKSSKLNPQSLSWRGAQIQPGLWLRPLFIVPTDIFALLVATWLIGIVLHGWIGMNASLLAVAPIAIPLLLLCAAGCYSLEMIHPAVELRKLTGAMALASLTLTLTGTGLPISRLGVAAALLSFCLRISCVVCARTLLRCLMNQSGFWLMPTIIIGSGPLAEQVLHTIQKHRHIGLKAISLVADQAPAGVSRSRALIDAFEGAVRVAQEKHVSEVIIADPGLREGDVEAVSNYYQSWFRRVVFVSSASTLGGVAVRATDLSGLLGLTVDRPALSHAPQLSKRMLDLSVAAVAGLCLLPVFVALYAIVRLTSPGPVFYGQRRIGRSGRYFKAWKFRSMVVDADAVLQQHLAKDECLREEWDRTHKLKNDPRILPIGHFLRQTSLDELPQLWNVLRGEMSLVGPRPIVDAEVCKYGGSIEYYKAVRPGVTGMWQISGRSQTSYAERVRYDEYFVKNWSIWLDLYILFRTVKTVLLREGAC